MPYLQQILSYPRSYYIVKTLVITSDIFFELSLLSSLQTLLHSPSVIRHKLQISKSFTTVTSATNKKTAGTCSQLKNALKQVRHQFQHPRYIGNIHRKKLDEDQRRPVPSKEVLVMKQPLHPQFLSPDYPGRRTVTGKLGKTSLQLEATSLLKPTEKREKNKLLGIQVLFYFLSEIEATDFKSKNKLRTVALSVIKMSIYKTISEIRGSWHQ